MEISFGHTASQAPVKVQLPNPSLSIWATMLITRLFLSGCPCGSKPRCATFAERNNEADAFLHAATHAPQAMQAAAANEASALSFSTGMALPSTALPVFTEIKPPAWMIRSNAVRSVTRSLITGKPFARQGSTTMVSPSLKPAYAAGRWLSRARGHAAGR